MINLFFVFVLRTKWKRQNQLRLEQLRQQTNVDKTIMSRQMSPRTENDNCCGSRYQSEPGTTCNFFPTTAAILRSVTYVHGCSL